MSGKVSMEEAKVAAKKVFNNEKGTRLCKCILENFSGFGVKRPISYLDGEIYFNLGAMDRAYASLGLMVRRNAYAKNRNGYEYALCLGRFPSRDGGLWYNPAKKYYFKTETDLIKALKEIANMEYTGKEEGDFSKVQMIARKYAKAYCGDRGEIINS